MRASPNFDQSFGPIGRPASLSIIFGITKIDHSIFELTEPKEKVGGSGSYKPTHLQALSLTTAPWLCHRRVIRVLSPCMLSRNRFFSVAHRFGAKGRKCSNGRQTITVSRRLNKSIRIDKNLPGLFTRSCGPFQWG